MLKTRIILLLIVVLCLVGYLQTQPRPKIKLTRSTFDAIAQMYKVKRISVMTEGKVQYLEGPGRIEEGAILAVSLDEPPRRTEKKEGVEYALPYRFGIMQQTGSPQLPYELVVLVQGGAIEYRPDQNKYLGSIRVGARDAQNPDLIQDFRGVEVMLVIDPGKINPELVQIESTRPSSYKTVTTEAAAIQGDIVKLNAIPSFNLDDKKEYDINVRRPDIKISANPERIQGFGLQACRLTVEIPKAYAVGNLKFALRATRGKLDPEVVEINAATGAGMSSLYSSGIGISEVSLASGDLLASQTVHSVFPFAFLISALIGGVVGGIIKGRRSIKVVVVGILIGMVVSIGAVLGINLLEINVVDIYTTRGFSEALLFLIAALGAFLGRLVIKAKS
jgi:hypothetical protein